MTASPTPDLALGYARSGAAAIDQGLRAYMIGVYNYMTLGLGMTGVVAFVAFKLGVVENGERPHRRPDRLRPRDLRFAAALAGDLRAAGAGVRHFGRHAIRCRSARRGRVFFAFAALIGLSLSTVFVVYTQALDRAGVLRDRGAPSAR